MSLLVYNTFSIAAFSSGDLNVAASLLYKSLNYFNASLDFVTVTRLSGTDKGMSCSIRARLYGHSTSSHSAEEEAEVETVPRSAEVEAEVEGALSRMLILAGPSAFILGSSPLCHKPTR